MPQDKLRKCEIVVPDAGPMITLAYADSLDLLLSTGLEVAVVDAVRHELTRSPTPTSRKIISFLEGNNVPIAETDTGQRLISGERGKFERHAGERAIQDYLLDFRDQAGPDRFALLLFEEYRIAGTAFVLPDNVYLLSTVAFLRKLQELEIIKSADEIMHVAREQGRSFSTLDLDKPPKSE